MKEMNCFVLKHFTSTYLIPVCCTITVWESLESVSITWNIKHVSGHHKGAFLITDTRGQHFQTLLCCSTNKLGHILQEHVHMLCCFYIFMWNYFCTALPPKILTLYLNQIEKKQGTEREKRSVIHTKKYCFGSQSTAAAVHQQQSSVTWPTVSGCDVNCVSADAVSVICHLKLLPVCLNISTCVRVCVWD